MQRAPSLQDVEAPEAETQAASPEEVQKSLKGDKPVPASPTSSLPSSASALEKDQVL